ncbi:MAG: disulfide oxidoreductase YuzD [Flavobacteriales bacterium]|jgi:disulfide oxidoreductase YuzD
MFKVIPSLVLFVALLINIQTVAQNPADEIDFGKVTFKNGEVEWKTAKKKEFTRTPSSEYKTIGQTIEELNAQGKLKIHHSRTFLGDTTSVSMNGEYIEFRDNSSSKKPIAIYQSDVVTNQDWLLFKRYVRDSIARKLLSNFVSYEDWSLETFDDENQLNDNEYWVINWEPKINWKKEEGNDMFNIISRLYYESHERYYEQLQTDQRKLNYGFTSKYSNSENEIQFEKEWCNVFQDSLLWIRDTSLNHFSNIEDGLVQFYNSHEIYQNYPTSCINIPQGRAYLNWLETNHNKQLNSEEFIVRYEVAPNHSQLQNITAAKFKLSNWRITNEKYEEFVNYTRDSIARYLISEQIKGKELLNFMTPTLDDVVQVKDEFEWYINWNTKLDWKNKTYKGGEYGLLSNLFYSIQDNDTNIIDKRKLHYEKYYFDFKTAAIELNRELGKTSDYKQEECNKTYLVNYPQNSRNESDPIYFRGAELTSLGKNLDLSYININCNSSDVYAHKGRSLYIIKSIINVYPNINSTLANRNCLINSYLEYEYAVDSIDIVQAVDCKRCPQIFDWDFIPEEYDFKSEPDALITDISYLQFQAYWRWRIRRGELPNKNENPVISHYIPSEAEFNKIQAGELITHPSETHYLPTPTLSYRVLFYLK